MIPFSELMSIVSGWLTQSGLIPISAIVTIVIFIMKEHIESRRKQKTKKNEIAALKKVFVRECELNTYVSNQIFDICKKFEPYENGSKKCPYKISILKSPSGKTSYEIIGDEDGMHGGNLPDVHMRILEKYMYGVVKLDSVFYEKLESAYEATLELKHLRDSIVDIRHTGERIHVDNLMLGFSGYALRELQQINRSLQDLYKYCTNEDVIKVKLR